jgi:hypothetical protein
MNPPRMEAARLTKVLGLLEKSWPYKKDSKLLELEQSTSDK